MTSRRLGHRAAAWGSAREAPVSGDPMSWMLAYDAAEVYRKRGLDPSGHPPRIPGLCIRDVSKVCNCCESCRTHCWAETFDGTAARVREVLTSAKSLLRKMIGR